MHNPINHKPRCARVPSAAILPRQLGTIEVPVRAQPILHFAVATGELITRDRMLTWIEEADADKGEKARSRLTTAG